MKRVLALALIGALIPQLAVAQIFEKVGTFSGQFLKIGVSARATGMASSRAGSNPLRNVTHGCEGTGTTAVQSAKAEVRRAVRTIWVGMP